MLQRLTSMLVLCCKIICSGLDKLHLDILDSFLLLLCREILLFMVDFSCHTLIFFFFIICGEYIVHFFDFWWYFWKTGYSFLQVFAFPFLVSFCHYLFIESFLNCVEDNQLVFKVLIFSWMLFVSLVWAF